VHPARPAIGISAAVLRWSDLPPRGSIRPSATPWPICHRRLRRWA